MQSIFLISLLATLNFIQIEEKTPPERQPERGSGRRDLIAK